MAPKKKRFAIGQFMALRKKRKNANLEKALEVDCKLSNQRKLLEAKKKSLKRMKSKVSIAFYS